MQLRASLQIEESSKKKIEKAFEEAIKGIENLKLE